MKDRRKIFFSPIPNDSLLQILLTIVSSLSYFIIILQFIEPKFAQSYLKNYIH